MSPSQKKVHDSWYQILREFAKREWVSLFTSSAAGIFTAEAVHLVVQDHAFQSFLITRYKPAASFDDPKYYLPYITVFATMVVLAIGPLVSRYVNRGIRSLWTGVTSGLVLLPF